MRASLALAGFGIMTGWGITGAVAQAVDCAAYRAELAGISRSVDPRAQEYTVAAQRQRAELERTRAYFDQIGCTRTDIYRPPAECSSLRTHMRQMQANLNEMLAYADRLGGGQRSQARRRELQAALDRYCANEPARPRGFLERLFGGGQPAPADEPPPTAPAPERATAPATEKPAGGERGLGGSQPVCVRLADGYFFPLGARYRGREQAQQMCQAQCPATRTELFFMSEGGKIERAQSASGVPYSTLPTALVYQKRLVPEAACLPAGQSWADALQGAETLIGRNDDDIIVTAEKADELSRPGAARAARQAAVQPAAAGDAEEIPDTAAVPTASGESAGIGPAIAGEDRPLSRKDGRTIVSSGPDGSRRSVRIVAPYLVPVQEPLHGN
ncbi:hypothetical protein FHS82_000310 [Pseudochelatococcus lubricantis]|uniref:DUF2865 domain-containing protein n=1 Tax=Pseudochelatococcus lubricantis TaxID=1538102 RepID=A0ABX0UU64_9HYPH|nr:DUF2865 domain-containing protein [Pseudochelatococcus lubricantis]NIJ56497.1 hypothetical protein [Pseudochelatococcus lubricantis]